MGELVSVSAASKEEEEKKIFDAALAMLQTPLEVSSHAFFSDGNLKLSEASPK